VTPDSGPHSIAKWDSAGHMSLLVEIEKEYGVQFNDDEVVELVSVEAVIEALARHGAQP
jgi:acyl carrier protein